MTANEGNVVTEQPVAEPEAPAPTELQAAPQPAEPVAEQPPAEQAAESPAEQAAAVTMRPPHKRRNEEEARDPKAGPPTTSFT